jgi:iron complex outermembrane receptor protein
LPERLKLFYGPVHRVVDKQIALFGEGDLQVHRYLEGSRSECACPRSTYTGVSYAGGAFTGGPTTRSRRSASEKPVTPKGVFAWQPDRDNMFYVSASKGYRVGGVNVGVGTICNGDLTSSGCRSDPMAMRHVPTNSHRTASGATKSAARILFWIIGCRSTPAYFVINWKNIQQNVYLPSCGEQFVANLGQVQSRGGDIDVQYKPIEPLTVGCHGGLHRCAVHQEFLRRRAAVFRHALRDPSSGSDFAPDRHRGQPAAGRPWSFVGSAEYVFAQWRNRSPYVRADFQYQNAQTALLPGQDSANGLNDTTIPGLPINKNLNLRGGMRWDGFDVSVFANNVTDSHPQLFLSRDIAAISTSSTSRAACGPRTVGVTATYRY